MNRTRSQSGFTLIEILVVIAIVALLLAILLPALQKARNISRAAVCGSNIREGIRGVSLHQTSIQSQKERWSTNFGWAVYSLKQNKGQTDLFTCPSDSNPLPVPAIFDRLFDGPDGSYRGTTTGDGIFNRVLRNYPTTGLWTTDVQDQVDEAYFGGDAYDDPAGDLLVEYQPVRGKDFISATLRKGVATWRHDVYSYQGKLLAENVSGRVPANVPVLWMSYGTNASAGLKNVKGRPVLVVEAAKLGVFAENLSGYPSDHLGWALRFRHGGTANADKLAGADYTAGTLGSRPPQSGGTLPDLFKDKSYVPLTTMNVGFLDGSVERKAYWDVMDVSSNTARPTPKARFWIGSRTADNFSY